MQKVKFLNLLGFFLVSLVFSLKAAADGFVYPIWTSLQDAGVSTPNTTNPFGGNHVQAHGHLGEDYTGATTEWNVRAAFNGTVVYSGFHGSTSTSGFGESIVIQHTHPSLPNGVVYSLYSHLSQRSKQLNQTVTTGEVIGRTGSTGFATGDHLHFEIKSSSAFGAGYLCSTRLDSQVYNPNCGVTLVQNTFSGNSVVANGITYYKPSWFIPAYRNLPSGSGSQTLYVTKSGTGSGTVTSSPAGINCGNPCSASFNSGTSVTLTATAATGSTFAGWSGACTGTGSCSVSMTQARNVTATFNTVAASTYALTVNSSGAASVAISSSPSAYAGTTNYTRTGIANNTSITLTAPAASGNANFSGWSGCNSTSGTNCTVSMTANKTVTASYTTPTLLTAPTLSSPSIEQSGVSTTPTFSWSSVSGANSYWLTVSTNQNDLPTDPNTSNCTGCVSTGLSVITTSTSHTAGTQTGITGTTRVLTPGTTYYWKVQAWNTNGTQGNYSAVRSFTTASASTAPTVTTNAVSSLGQSGATLNGLVNPNGSSTSTYFQYGQTTAYGTQTTAVNIGSGASAQSTSTNITGLSCGTTYNFRAVATNAQGTTNGANQSFTTTACPASIYTLTVNSSGASAVAITASPSNYAGTTNYKAGIANDTVITLTAPASSGGASFSSWSGCNSIFGTSCKVSMTANKTVTANYSSVSAERDALIAFYNATNGNNWTNKTGWLGEPGTECSWFGITCVDGRVTAINMRPIVNGFSVDNNLTGSLPSAIGNFSNLTFLDLGGNQLSGSLPDELWQLSNLHTLSLWGNGFTGPISENVGLLHNLRSLILWSNQFSGTLPSSIGGISSLWYLSLDNNQFTGEIPTTWVGLENLRLLDLSNNQLTGVVPTGLYELPLLTSIQVSGNQIQVPLAVPAERDALIALYNATNGDNWTNNTGWLGEPGTECNWFGITCFDRRVTVINMRSIVNGFSVGNNLTGSLPSAIGSFSNLNYLDLGGNQLSGSLPDEFWQLSNLQSLSLSGNGFTGPISENVGFLGKLLFLSLWSNQFSGTLPSSIGGISSLVTLNLYNNQFTGAIPTAWVGLENLRQLNLSGNQLTGLIPGEIGQLSKLEVLSLSNNQLSGMIPAQLGGLGLLKSLWLHNNQLSGAIPAELLGLSNLQSLELQNNQLTGSVPHGLDALPLLTTFNVSGNPGLSLLPPDSMERGVLIAFYSATGGDSWTNKTGWLGESGTECNWFGVTCDTNGFVTSLNLSNNNLIGTLPVELGQLTRLQSLNVSNNQLTGVVPAVFADGVVINVENNPLDLNEVIDPDTPRQIISLPGNPTFRLGSANTLSFFYDVSDADSTLTGLGIRVHIDSRKIDVAEFANVLTHGLTGIDTTWSADTANYDENIETDSFVTIAWVDISGNWPGSLPIKLFDLQLTAFDSVTTLDTIHVGFSAISTVPGYVADLPKIALAITNITLDVDGNGKVEALTDALMILRRLFGFSGPSLIDRAVATDATFVTAIQIQERLQQMQSILDVDGNGQVDALTDGLLIMRYVFGFRGSVLISNAIGSGAQRTTSGQIEEYLSGLVH